MRQYWNKEKHSTCEHIRPSNEERSYTKQHNTSRVARRWRTSQKVFLQAVPCRLTLCMVMAASMQTREVQCCGASTAAHEQKLPLAWMFKRTESKKIAAMRSGRWLMTATALAKDSREKLICVNSRQVGPKPPCITPGPPCKQTHLIH
jgi:hypothetical protein